MIKAYVKINSTDTPSINPGCLNVELIRNPQAVKRRQDKIKMRYAKLGDADE